MRQYLDLLLDILDNGELHEDRTGTGAISVFGRQMRFALDEPVTRFDDDGMGSSVDGLAFPLLTTKRVFWKGIVAELLWMISGSTNIKPLVDQGVSIWTDWPLQKYNAYLQSRDSAPVDKATFERWIRENGDRFAERWGDLGPVYGKQWRSWRRLTPLGERTPVDQLANLIAGIEKDPFGRRHIISAWNPAELDEMALPPCHAFMQFWVSREGKLSCQLYQRSADMFLGVPFNIAFYALFTKMIAQVCGLKAGEFVWTGGDVHIYANHVSQVCEQLRREPRPLPIVRLNPEIKSIDDFRAEDVHLDFYDPHPPIKAPVAV